MTPQVRAKLIEWLESGDEGQRRHARTVLDLGAGPPQTSYPSVWQMAGNALGAVVTFAASGFCFANEEEQARRLAICQECEHHDKAAHRCRACGCYVDLKSLIASSSCPRKKW